LETCKYQVLWKALPVPKVFVGVQVLVSKV